MLRPMLTEEWTRAQADRLLADGGPRRRSRGQARRRRRGASLGSRLVGAATRLIGAE
jgi:hypothetical protein